MSPLSASSVTRFLRYWTPAILWACVIFYMSTETFSGQATAEWVIPLLRRLLPHASAQTLNSLHFLIRKSGHVVEYFVFSLLLLYAVRGRRHGWMARWGLAAVAVAAGYAITDEAHQAFVPGRVAAVKDVLLDSSGAALAQLIAWLWNHIHTRFSDRQPKL